MNSQCILVLNRFFSTLCLFINVNSSASKMMDLCFPPAGKLIMRSASFQNHTGSSKSLKWENKAGNTGICSCHKRQDFPQGQPLLSCTVVLVQNQVTRLTQSRDLGKALISFLPLQTTVSWNEVRSTPDLLVLRAVLHQESILPSQETVNLSLPLVNRRGNAALIQSSDRGLGAVNPPRISLDAIHAIESVPLQCEFSLTYKTPWLTG